MLPYPLSLLNLGGHCRIRVHLFDLVDDGFCTLGRLGPGSCEDSSSTGVGNGKLQRDLCDLPPRFEI